MTAVIGLQLMELIKNSEIAFMRLALLQFMALFYHIYGEAELAAHSFPRYPKIC
jgi:hypothetical protein